MSVGTERAKGHREGKEADAGIDLGRLPGTKWSNPAKDFPEMPSDGSRAVPISGC